MEGNEISTGLAFAAALIILAVLWLQRRMDLKGGIISAVNVDRQMQTCADEMERMRDARVRQMGGRFIPPLHLRTDLNNERARRLAGRPFYLIGVDPGEPKSGITWYMHQDGRTYIGGEAMADHFGREFDRKISEEHGCPGCSSRRK